MRSKIRLVVASLLFAMFVVPNFGPALRAQAAGVPTAEELDQLLAPVALYPDSLLSQITTASTNPQEILDAHRISQRTPRFLHAHSRPGSTKPARVLPLGYLLGCRR